jgi:PadR family transcriptional regulator, regulatory protein PadR
MHGTTSKMLARWEEVYKRSLLSFWLLLLLSEQEMYAYKMGAAIRQISHGTVIADDNSIYRALRRFADSGLVASEKRESARGPARRYFWLTPSGRELLRQFVERNIFLFHDPQIVAALQRATSTAGADEAEH